MPSLVFLLIAICCVSGSGFAQSDTKAIRVAQKELKKALIKHTSNVYGADYAACEASVKVVTGSSTTFENIRSMPPQGSAGFPTDTFWTNDFGIALRGIGKTTRYLLDLSGLDPTKITIRKGLRKTTSVITLSVGDDARAMRIKKDDAVEPVSSFFVTAHTKHASKLASAMKTAIERCSEAN